ncbi:hypothetical protein C900_02051 [Fulvivirga imtechensis AK7]|uniref:Uncharacterized protein n=2 Tax=Fulvivirga TaxID=396811 RepID=L8K2G8_9BACT|nr:hypothetical protein C900_02051 [Fulvivirga imtechensis AK7]
MWKRILKMILYIIILLGIIFIGYLGLQRLEKMEEKKVRPEQLQQGMKNKTSRPGVLINVRLNTKNNGKT